MSTIDSLLGSGARTDPFAYTTPPQVSDRPRLLSYVGRWGRARRWLPAAAMRVLDVGCASAYGSAALLAHGPPGRVVVGVERDHELLGQARRRFPWIEVVEGDAGALPLLDSCADAIVLLDVIEHMADPGLALREAHRVLRPGGTIIVTVPHSGPTQALDAVNVYGSLRRHFPSWPELEGVVGTEEKHRHFSAAELTGLLEPDFTVDRVARTGLGLQELVSLTILALEVPLGSPRLARVVAPAHLMAYIFDDLLPTGPFAYHLGVRARSNKQAGVHNDRDGTGVRSMPLNGNGAGGRRADSERNLQ